MPQAIEWSLATPITSPRLPSISPGILPFLPRRHSGARSEPANPESRCLHLALDSGSGAARRPGMTGKKLRIQPLERHRGIGAAEAERVRQHGAAGAQEAIYSLLMMQHGLICESATLENLDPA